MPIGMELRSFLHTYMGDHQKTFDLHFKNFFRDPVASIFWWLRFSMWIIASFKHLGK
jgi:hypothetical protein